MKGKKEKSFTRKRELIDAAITEFGQKGYENASLNSILQAAGISKGAFYYHFDNKDDLYVYLVNVLIEEKKKFLAERFKPEDFQRDFFGLLESLTKAGIEFAKVNPLISKFSQSFIKDRGRETHAKIIKDAGLEANEYFAGLVDEAFRRGEIRRDLPLSFVKRLISFLFTHLYDLADIGRVDDCEAAVENLVRFLRDGLAERAAR